MTDIPPVICDRAVRLRHLNEAFKAAPHPSLALCRWLGVPHRTDCPTPGEARNWGKNEWNTWGEKHGYVYHGDTSHNFMWTHPLTNLRVGLAKTSGDFRSPMALACQVRREIAAFTDAAVNMLETTPDPADPDTPPEALLTLLKPVEGTPDDASDATLRAIVGRMARALAQAVDGPSAGTKASVVRAAVPAAQVMALLQRIQRDYDWQPRRSLATLLGESRTGADRQNRVEQILALLKVPDAEVSVSMLEDLEDLRDQLRTEDEAENERKRATREARTKPTPAPLPTAPSHREVIQDSLNRRRQTIIDQLHRVEQATKSAVDRTMLAIQSIPLFDLPEHFDDPALTAEVEQLRAANAASAARIAEAEARANEWCERATRAEAAAEQLQLQHTAQLRAHLQAFAGLVADTVRGAANMNPFALVASLNALAQEADAAIAFAKSTEPPAPEAGLSTASAAGSAA